jgi:hypothetical protein
MTTQPIPPRRLSNTHLPGVDEMSLIAAAEMQRPLAPSKEGVHYVDFSAMEAVCAQFDLPTDLFELDEKDPKRILEVGGKLLDELVAILLTKTPDPETLHLLEDAYAYLGEEDKPQASDLMFIFGGRTPLRMEKAIELFKAGLAPEMLISGHGPFYGEEGEVSEAQKYADLAIAADVPKSAIIVEDKSITLVDNIRRSLNILDEAGKSFSSLIIVNSPFTQRRGWCMWRKYLPDECQLYRVNCGTGPNFTSDNWYHNEDGIRVILGEFVKLRNAIAFDSV